MKKLIVIPLVLMMLNAWAQSTPVKIAFDLTSKDEAAHQTTMRHVTAMSKAYPDSQFEVVIYGGAIEMALKDKSTVADQIKAFEDNENVSIKVCEGTMKRYNIEKSQLLPGIGTVPDGILELVQKQKEGWGYIKEVPN